MMKTTFGQFVCKVIKINDNKRVTVVRCNYFIGGGQGSELSLTLVEPPDPGDAIGVPVPSRRAKRARRTPEGPRPDKEPPHEGRRLPERFACCRIVICEAG